MYDPHRTWYRCPSSLNEASLPGQVTDYAALLAEAARILRPGGLLLSVEFSWYYQSDLPNPDPASLRTHMPEFSRLALKLAEFFHPTGLRTRAEEVPLRIKSLDVFKDDTSVVHTVRILVASVFVSETNDTYAGAGRTSPARRRPRRAWKHTS
jgi:SAM-dependent methyltransferase